MAEKDMTEKALEAYNDVFADIVNVLLFNGEDKVKENELEQATERSVYKADGKLRDQERDTSKYWRKNSIRIAYFGLENETEPEDDIPFRIIGYDGAAYRDQISYELDENGIRKKNKNPRYPVISLVLYFGLKPWNKPKTLYEVLGDHLTEDVKSYVADYPINLFEIAHLTDKQIGMFKSDFHIVADYFVQMRKNKDYRPSDAQIRHVRELLQLMSVLTNDHRFEDAVNGTRKGVETNTMSEVLDRVEERGEKRGEKKGRNNQARETAQRLIKRGKETLEEIAEDSGLSLDEVKLLAAQ